MAHNYEKVVGLISMEPEERDDREVDLLIPWFQNMSGLFKSQKTDVVKDIVRNCDFLSVPTDTVIIQQGAKGDCFYIILSGSVSVYINQALEEQGNVPQSSLSGAKKNKRPHSTPRSSRPNTRSRSPSGRGSKLASSKVSHASPSRCESHDRSVKSGQVSQHQDPNSSKDHADDGKSLGDQDVKNYAIYDSPSKAVKIVVEDFSSESQSDSGQYSDSIIIDENDNHIFENKDDDDDDDDDDDEGSDVDDDYDSEFDYSSAEDDMLRQTTSTSKFDRASFGVHIRELGAGKCFGEVALVQTNLTRTATILTDQETNLIVINRELYNRSLKAAQQHEFNLKRNFVNTFPLFRSWTPRQRSVMTMSLTRYQYQYGNTMVKQGAPVKGIHFITHGSAKVSTDTIQHIAQYPYLCSEKDVQFAKDVKTGRGTRTSHPRLASWESDSSRRGVQHCVRRKETYAEAEKHLNYKNMDMCVISSGDYMGDFEVLLRLPTYSCSVQCLEGVDAFELDLNNFERQIVKKSPTTYASLRETAETKMRARVKRLNRDEQIYMPVLEVMLNRLKEMNSVHGWKIKNRTKPGASSVDGGGDDIMGPPAPWHDYREKQRQFLRRRKREKHLEEMRNIQMAHAASLGLQLEMQNMPPANVRSVIPNTTSSIEQKAAEFFPDVPSNVRLRVDPVTGLIRATEVRVPRHMIYQNNGRHAVPRSKRELVNAFAEGSKSDSYTDRSSESSESFSKLLTPRLKNFTLNQRHYQSSITSTSSVSSSSEKLGKRPASGKKSRTRNELTVSRSAGSYRPYSLSF